MTSRSTRESLQVQLLDTERMLELVGDHPIMSFSLKQRAQALREKLDQIPIDQREPKVVLLFSGKPVMGSMGIDANFAGRVLPPFQNMIKTDFAQRMTGGREGKRGRAKLENQSQMFVTSLPRGSFGIELEKLESYSLFDSEYLADSLVHVTHLIEASAKSDEDFAVALDEATTRTVKGLNDFLKVVSEEGAGVTIESGGVRCVLSQEDARIAYDRVSTTSADENEIVLEGVLRGATLDSWRFDFATIGEVISGRISNDLTEEEVKSFLVSFLDEPCTATLEVSRVVFQNGREKITYQLLNISKPDEYLSF